MAKTKVAHMIRRVNFNLPQSVVDKLTALAEQLELTNTQALREAIEVRSLLQEELDQGGKLIIERKSGELVRLMLTGA